MLTTLNTKSIGRGAQAALFALALLSSAVSARAQSARGIRSASTLTTQGIRTIAPLPSTIAGTRSTSGRAIRTAAPGAS